MLENQLLMNRLINFFDNVKKKRDLETKKSLDYYDIEILRGIEAEIDAFLRDDFDLDYTKTVPKIVKK